MVYYNSQLLLLLVIVAASISNTSSSVVISRNSESNFKGLEKSGQVLIAKTVSQNVITRLEKELKEFNFLQNPKGTLLPPIDDPACLQPGELKINVTIPPVTLFGTVELTSPATVTGLSKIVDNFELRPSLPNKLIWDLQIPEVAINGEYSQDLILDIGYPSTVSGTGDLVVSASDVFLNFDASLKAPVVGPVSLLDLVVDLGVSNLAIDAHGANLNGTLIDWSNISEYLQTYLNTIWNEETRPLITEMIRCSVDHVINECNINQIINGNKDCLKLELNPECFNDKSESVQSAFFEKNTIWADSCRVNSEEPSQGTESTKPSQGTEGPTTTTTQSGAVRNPYYSAAVTLIPLALVSFPCLIW